MREEDYILLSDIHNYSVCPRRWALRTFESQKGENWRLIDGANMHNRVHDSNQREKRGNIIIMRALRVVSHTLGVSGECDVVEFSKSEKGVELKGYEGKYVPFPIEYKRGIEPKDNNCDKRQLCAQAMCLEEMLLCNIERGALFYGETHRRVEVYFSAELRNEVIQTAKEIHRMVKLEKTPKAIQNSFCKQCSLLDKCLPYLNNKKSVSSYIKKYLESN